MSERDAVTTPRPETPENIEGGLAAWRDQALLGVAARWLAGKLRGRITVTMPSGVCRTLGHGPLHADIQLRSLAVIWKAGRRGTLGFAEAYIDGDIETSNLANVFRFFIDNRKGLVSTAGRYFSVRGRDVRAHAERRNTRDGSRRNISDHYDLGNDFYALWLDPGMAYSSGIYLAPDATLDDAQSQKYADVLSALGDARGGRLLEIGCGWGGFVEAAAADGANVDAITISRRQLAYTIDRVEAAGLSDRAAVRFEDYRDTTGTYDGIASIEMIEAVGEEHWPVYFRTLHDRLRPGGTAAVQAITIRQASYDDYRSKPDFIQRYVFPGGMLPTRDVLVEQAARAGLEFSVWREFGASYARTLGEWRRRFHDQWPQISALGFDDRFRRLWDYYLTYCEVGFEKGVINVGIYRFRRPDAAAS